MSALMHPAGPEPPMVYWIRRAAVVVVAVTVLALVWWLIGAVRGGDEPAVGQVVSSGSAAASAAPPASASAAPAASAQPTSEASAAVQPVACEDAAIAVTSTTDASTYPVGSTPRLTLTIENTGTVPCKRDVGPKANELSITSGGYHVWSSDDCNASNKSKVVVLKPGEKLASSITWNGNLTSPGCPNGEGPAAKAGTYRVEGRNLKVTSDPTPFSLTNKS